MKFTTLAASAALVLGIAEATTFLFPIPQSVNWTGNTAALSSHFVIKGARNKHVQAAAKRYAELIVKERWIPVQVAYEAETLGASRNPLVSLDISVSDNTAKLDFGVDESYALTVPAEGGRAKLTAPTWVGALRGLETFSQLVQQGPGRGLIVHTASITDAPSYPHRGILLDTARNFFPIPDILRTIDALAYNKMNVFHWHATDAQSFPLQLKSHPELWEKGAYSRQEVYTPKDIKTVLNYAEARGVRVVLEIDVPAHTGIIAEAHPDFIIGYDKFWAPYAAEPPAGQIDLVNDGAWQLVKDIVKEATEIFPDAFYHTGGDEINTAVYETDKDLVDYTASHNITTKELWWQWTNKLIAYVTDDLGKRPILWEDPIADGGDFPKHTVVQVWTHPPENYTSAGYDVIVSNSDYFYLDCGNGGWVGDDNRYISPTQQPTPDDTFNYGGTGGSWCAPYHTWQRMYSFDPTYNIPDNSPGKVLGVELPYWTEQGGPSTLDAKLWPRSGAAAEIFWSGPYNKDGDRRTLREVLPRISDWGYRLAARGIAAQPLQPKWCVKHPEMCNLNDPK
ncbi:glycoside hydrolase superfamily [Dichotomocladium elegans]|nr:glycoside hydrolase superfamily [Dichotomocladium elegans]